MSTGRERTEYERVEFGPGGRPSEEQVRVTEEGRRFAATGGEAPQRRAPVQGEQVKRSVASGLHTAAERLRSQGAERGQEGMGVRVAEPLERSAQYLESHSLSQISEDASGYARGHPLVTAAGVFTAAFLLGRLMRRR